MSQDKPTRLTDRKRAAILRAAVKEFRHSGFESTSMDRIAEGAQVSKRTVYNHFPSKEDLFLEIVNQLASKCQTMGEFPFNPHQSLKSQLTRIGQTVIEVAASPEFQNLARVVLSRFLQAPELATEMLRGPRQYEARLIEWIEAAQKSDQLIEVAPNRAVKQFLALIHAFALWPPLMGGEPLPTEAEKQEIVHSAVTLFLARYAK